MLISFVFSIMSNARNYFKVCHLRYYSLPEDRIFCKKFPEYDSTDEIFATLIKIMGKLCDAAGGEGLNKAVISCLKEKVKIRHQDKKKFDSFLNKVMRHLPAYQEQQLNSKSISPLTIRMVTLIQETFAHVDKKNRVWSLQHHELVNEAKMSDPDRLTADQGEALSVPTSGPRFRENTFEDLRNFFDTHNRRCDFIQKRLFDGQSLALDAASKKYLAVVLEKAVDEGIALRTSNNDVLARNENISQDDIHDALNFPELLALGGVGILFDEKVVPYSTAVRNYLSHTALPGMRYQRPENTPRIDVLAVSALISWKFTAHHVAKHRVFRRTRNEAGVLEIVKVVRGAPTIENSFTSDSYFGSTQERINLFWKIQRSHGVQEPKILLAYTLRELQNRGARLTFRGQLVENVVILNSVASLEGLDLGLKYRYKGHEVPFYFTPDKESKLKTLPHKILDEMLEPRVDTFNARRRVAPHTNKEFSKASGLSLDNFVPYWWIAFVLPESMVHVDLSGTAYDLFEYHLVPGGGCKTRPKFGDSDSEESALLKYGEHVKAQDLAAAPLYAFVTHNYRFEDMSVYMERTSGNDTVELNHKLQMKQQTRDGLSPTLGVRAMAFRGLQGSSGIFADATPLPEFLNVTVERVWTSPHSSIYKSAAYKYSSEMISLAVASHQQHFERDTDDSPNITAVRVVDAIGTKKRYNNQEGTICRQQAPNSDEPRVVHADFVSLYIDDPHEVWPVRLKQENGQAPIEIFIKSDNLRIVGDPCGMQILDKDKMRIEIQAHITPFSRN